MKILYSNSQIYRNAVWVYAFILFLACLLRKSLHRLSKRQQ